MLISKRNTAIIVLAVLYSVAFAYFYLDLSPDDLDVSRGGFFWSILFIVLISGTVGVFYAIRQVQTWEQSDDEWDGLKSAFPDRFQVLGAVRFSSSGRAEIGIATVGEIGSQLAIPIVISVLDNGLMLSKNRQWTSKKDVVCIPWERLRTVEVLKPKHLKNHQSPEDHVRLNRDLAAVLTVLRGDFPPFLMKVPWHERFDDALPPTVKLKRDWEWPI